MPKLSLLVSICLLMLIAWWAALVSYPELYWYQARLTRYWLEEGHAGFYGKSGYIGTDSFCLIITAIPLLAYFTSLVSGIQSLLQYFISLLILLLAAWACLFTEAYFDASRFMDISPGAASLNTDGKININYIKLEKIYIIAVITGTLVSLLANKGIAWLRGRQAK